MFGNFNLFVIDPPIQNGNILPKWSLRVSLGQFVVFSTDHSSTVGPIRLKIDWITFNFRHSRYESYQWGFEEF